MDSVLEKSIRIGCFAMKIKPFSKKYTSPWTALTLALMPLRPCALGISDYHAGRFDYAYFLKPPGGVTFLPVKDLRTLEMTWNVGASYFFCKSG
jgi:hypothetical protein